MRTPFTTSIFRVWVWIIPALPAFLSCLAAAAAAPESAPQPIAAAPNELPFVYTQWKHFTVKDGLPNDHIFAVKADGPRVWIGTEDGLACLDKRTGKIRSWREKDGLPWRVVTAIDVDKKTGEVWLGLFGGGLARFSAGRFDHFNQFNSGLVNDVVYGVAVENNNIWAATTAGASRYNTVTGQWTIFTEKNAPMEEIWNYGATYDRASNKVYLAIWGSGVLEFDVATERWKPYIDPDHEMEIDLYRDDGIVHVITTAASRVDGALWVSTYFGNCRYDGRHWRGYYAFETGFPSDFTNFARGRSANEGWFGTDKGIGVVADFPTDTVISYTQDLKTLRGKAVVYRSGKVLETIDLGRTVPHNYILGLDIDGDDVWIATSKGLAWAIGKGYYPGVRQRPLLGRQSSIVQTVTQTAEPAPGTDSTPKLQSQPSGKFSTETRSTMRELEGIGPHDLPNLKLKTDEKYAHIAKDLAPFHHVKPYTEHFLTQIEYTGPGRAIPEPDDAKSVKIGFIGPIKPTVSVATGGKSHEESLGTRMLQGAQLALEEANAKGGYLRRKIPFELVISNDNGLWGSSGNEIIKMAYKDNCWAIVGTVDGANSHIAIRVALKAEILVMNTADTDPTYIETNIPWTCRVIGDDRQMGYLLARYLYNKLGLKRVGVIRASNRYGRFGVKKFVDSSRRLEHPIILEMAYQVGSKDYSLQLDRLQQEDLDAIVHWGDAPDGALILNQMRARGMKQPYYACDRCLCDEFIKIAGANAEGVTCMYPWNPDRNGEPLRSFRKTFHQRFGSDPETYASHAYDGMKMLIWAVQAGGLNRAKVRDMIAYRTEPWKGVTGDIVLSSALDDIGEVYMARRENGVWKYYSREDLGIPGTSPEPSKTSAQTPFYDGRQRPQEYAGPEREAETPTDLKEVCIGYFGPCDPADPEGNEPWQAAQLAVEEANAAGGWQGKPFRLVPAWSGSPWAAGATRLAQAVYDNHAVAIVGGIDGPTTHLAEQIAVKARLPLVSPFSTDKAVNEAGVPGVFSCTPGDDQLAPVLADEVAARIGEKSFVLVSADQHDARQFSDEVSGSLSRLHISPRLRFEFKPEATKPAELATRILQGETAAVVVVAGPADSAKLVKALRVVGYQGLVFGGPCMGRRQFTVEAGAAGDGCLFPLLFAAGKQSEDFATAFSRRSGVSPDYASAHTYDAVRRLIAAICKSGPNRARTFDTLRSLSPWEGVTGMTAWERHGTAVQNVGIGTILQQRIVPVRFAAKCSCAKPDLIHP
jgi:branched-chain amino acid transport system substrate-binding protein